MHQDNSLLQRRIRKFVRSPYRFFADPISRRWFDWRAGPFDDAALTGQKQRTYAFHINEWKQPLLRGWFPDREFVFPPIKLSRSELRVKWLPRIRRDVHAEIMVWGMNLPAEVATLGRRTWHIEDGFLRSIGLGSNHTPPVSLIVDPHTLHFNAREPSQLEKILSSHDFAADEALMARARALLDRLLDSGLSKYNHAQRVDIESIYGPKTRKRILVIGQVEDDASIAYGCEKAYTNNDLVYLAALENPAAQILYKPHPDVLHQKRPMLSNPDDVRHISLVLDQDIPLTQSFETVDHVYTISSQAGMEALMRGIAVTTLGCPFYAGWGLTDDRQPNPRRQRQLGLLELFAACYILYPRYFNPFTREPITAEEALDLLQRLRNLQPAGTPAVADASSEPAAADAAARTRMGQDELVSHLLEDLKRTTGLLERLVVQQT